MITTKTALETTKTTATKKTTIMLIMNCKRAQNGQVMVTWAKEIQYKTTKTLTTMKTSIITTTMTATTKTTTTTTTAMLISICKRA